MSDNKEIIEKRRKGKKVSIEETSGNKSKDNNKIIKNKKKSRGNPGSFFVNNLSIFTNNW